MRLSTVVMATGTAGMALLDGGTSAVLGLTKAAVFGTAMYHITKHYANEPTRMVLRDQEAKLRAKADSIANDSDPVRRASRKRKLEEKRKQVVEGAYHVLHGDNSTAKLVGAGTFMCPTIGAFALVGQTVHLWSPFAASVFGTKRKQTKTVVVKQGKHNA